MIHAVITGNLGAAPELRYTNDGTPILKIRVASNSREKVDGEWKDVPTWCSVSVFGKRGESLAKLLDKGSRVCVRGALSVREYDKRDGGRGYSVDVRADEVELLGGKRDDAQQSAGRQETQRYGSSGHGASAKHSAPRDAGGTDDGAGGYPPDDDLPFVSSAPSRIPWRP